MESGDSLAQCAGTWLKTLETALVGRDQAALTRLFAEESYWRDQISLTWDVVQFAGRDRVVGAFMERGARASPRDFRLDNDRPAPTKAPYSGHQVIEAYFRFALPHGQGQGLVRLLEDPKSDSGVRCFTIGTDLATLDGVDERPVYRVSVADMHPKGPVHGYPPARREQTYADYLAEKQAFAQEDPDVLIIGGGHGGMSLGAQFERLGASYLIVERTSSPGATWRSRYDSLALHTISAINQLPFLELPAAFPDYIPKDRFADWLDAYQKLMGLNYWTNTEVVSGRFDPTDGRWAIDMKLADGGVRTLHPKHVVLATGGIGLTPRRIDLPGLKDFRGIKLHSQQFVNGKPYRGRRMLVIGSATSAFDVALDMCRCGAEVTMLQRSSVTVVPLFDAVRYMFDYLPGRGISRETADLRRAAGIIYPLMVRNLKLDTTEASKRNAGLYERLEKAGLRLDQGPDGTGWLMKLWRTFKGFYFEMGGAEAIANGEIKVLQLAEVDHFVGDGLVRKDGTHIPFDGIAFATGFLNQNEDIVAIFGAEIAKKVGPRIGIDASGEPLGQCKPLHHRQIWQMWGSLNDMRRMSRTLALEILAQMRGVVGTLERQADGTLTEL